MASDPKPDPICNGLTGLGPCRHIARYRLNFDASGITATWTRYSCGVHIGQLTKAALREVSHIDVRLTAQERARRG